MNWTGRRTPSAQSMLHVLGLAVALLAIAPRSAAAKGGETVSVAVTGSAPTFVASGAVAVGNTGAKAETISSMSASLEVRFPSGTTPPPLPPGSSSGWYTVKTVSVPAAPGLPPNGTVDAPYAIDTCGGGVGNYRGAKDMRTYAAVQLAANASHAARVVGGTSLNYALPAKCPVCGNGILESGEQCEPAGGSCCSATCRFLSDGSACSDGNACTQADQCRTGSCIGGLPIVCGASDQCHAAGTCNPVSGACSNPAKPNGTGCDDGNACTRSDSCQSGFCSGADPVVCTAADQCRSGACDPESGLCSESDRVDGSECADGNACTVADACASGQCQSGAARDCNDHMSCTDDTCDEATGCAHTPAAACDACDATECAACKDGCAASSEQCASSCWSAFFSCLNFCTSTYCAPFCQVDLSRCLTACPGAEPCGGTCESGNGCTSGCVAP